ncbi:uncharacterized protein isoform X2 [Danio rerio]|uniref:Uncharacterized protein isoform X2 n=1 Tax=Danio rerio TaxID=7955 RepID=A0AC58IMX2_DANRE
MFDTNSGNLTLLISDLTEKDEGLYSCWINENQHKSFSLTIKGCALPDHHPHIVMISDVGESVLLPCFCEDPQTKPKHFEWRRSAENETLLSDVEELNSRFQTIRDSAHNLSLWIWNLTEADGGVYTCTVNGKHSTNIHLTLTAKTNPEDFTSNTLTCSLISLICLMLILLVTRCIYWRFTTEKERSRRVIQRTDDEDAVTYSTVTLIKGRKTAEKQQQQGDFTYSPIVYSKPQNPEVSSVYASVQKDKK